MLYQLNKIFLAVLGCFIILSITAKQDITKAEENYTKPDSTSLSSPQKAKGYRDIVLYKDKYIAVGTDGRIDSFSKSGEKTPVENSDTNNLNCAFSNNEILLTAGEHGTILFSSDGKNFSHEESGIEENINGITSGKGLILACADKGKILESKDSKAWSVIQTTAEGNIMSLSVAKSFFIGVTDSGEIIKSTDGINWDIKNYNKEYAGYNEPAKFKKIIVTPNTIVIVGTHNDGSPAILFSTLGNVWAERIPIYHDEQGKISYLESKPNGLTYDPLMDEIILACDNGELFSLPSCSKCNKYLKISRTKLNAVIYNDNSLAIVGDGYYFFIQKL